MSDEKKRYEVTDIATQTQPVIIDNEAEEGKKQKDLHDILAEVANDVKAIRKTLLK